VQRNDRNPEATEGHRRGIRKQGQPRRLHRLETKAKQHGVAYCDRCPEPSSTFKESAEAECNQEQLQSAVLSDVCHALLQQVKSPRFDRQVIHEDHRKDDPENREKPVAGAINRGQAGQDHGHMEDEDSDGKGSCQGEQGGPMGFQLETNDGGEQDEQG
jgi:hypothetical protein